MKLLKIYLIAGALVISNYLMAQTEEKFPKHSFGVTISHATIYEPSLNIGEKHTLNIPMWGIIYNYQFARKWAVGLHTDILMETFKLEKEEGGTIVETIERSYPIAPAFIALYKPTEHWGFGVGAGEEFSKAKNYFLNRFSTEYSQEIKKGWEVFGEIQYDIRWKAYDTWSIGIGISKAL